MRLFTASARPVWFFAAERPIERRSRHAPHVPREAKLADAESVERAVHGMPRAASRQAQAFAHVLERHQFGKVESHSWTALGRIDDRRPALATDAPLRNRPVPIARRERLDTASRGSMQYLGVFFCMLRSVRAHRSAFLSLDDSDRATLRKSARLGRMRPNMPHDHLQYRAAICERVAEARTRANLTQTQLAARIGSAPRTVRGWESGVVPSADWIGLIADACDVSAEWLIGRPHGETVCLINRRIETELLATTQPTKATQHRLSRLSTTADRDLQSIETVEKFSARIAAVWNHLHGLPKEKDTEDEPHEPDRTGRRHPR